MLLTLVTPDLIAQEGDLAYMAVASDAVDTLNDALTRSLTGAH